MKSQAFSIEENKATVTGTWKSWSIRMEELFEADRGIAWESVIIIGDCVVGVAIGFCSGYKS